MFHIIFTACTCWTMIVFKNKTPIQNNFAVGRCSIVYSSLLKKKLLCVQTVFHKYESWQPEVTLESVWSEFVCWLKRTRLLKASPFKCRLCIKHEQTTRVFNRSEFLCWNQITALQINLNRWSVRVTNAVVKGFDLVCSRQSGDNIKTVRIKI